MIKNGYSLEWSERLFEMMKGFGGYGFPESHSASFALLVYVSAWMKRHHTSAFYCGLLNSLPMGFYSPSQLIHDARRHGIEVRPVDIQTSTWEYQLEDIERKALGVQPALRIGFRQIKGFNEDAARRIEQARSKNRFMSLNDVYQRAMLSKTERQVLVDADALRKLTGHRHQAHWQDQGIQESRPLFDYEHTQQDSDDIALDAPSEMESMLRDYQRLSLTLGKHPMALVRYRDEFKNCLTARNLKHARHGQLARVAGLVTNRQRPGTASGILFMTLEDETGNTNVIIWKSLQETFRQEILTGSLLLIKGTLEKSSDGIIHLIAGHVSDHSHVINDLAVKSRDFH